MTHEDTTPKTDLEVKIAFARQKLQELKGACQDPEVRNAICDLFWDAEDLEMDDSSAESIHDNNYSSNESAEIQCAITLDHFYISGGGEDDDGNELPYKYENV